MKKSIMLTLLLLTCSFLIGCSNNTSTNEADMEKRSMSYEEFEQKWQYEDFEQLLSDPSEFETDYFAVLNYVREFTRQGKNAFEGWDASAGNEENQITHCTKDIQICNRKMTLNGLNGIKTEEDGKESVVNQFNGLICDSGSTEDDYTFAKAIALYVLDTHPENCKIDVSIDSKTTTETDLRKLLQSGEIKNFNLSISKEDYSYVRYISFSESWSSFMAW